MKKNHKLIGIAASAGLLVGIVGLAGAPAGAAPSGDTTATFTITGGSLDVTVPATSNFGSTPAGAQDFSASLGTVSVSDTRGSMDASWTASVTSTDFSTGGGTPAETVLSTGVGYDSGSATATTGDGTFTPDGTDNLDPGGDDAFTHVGGTGVNTASWNPTITLHLTDQKVVGVYTGTITHSVA